MTTSEKITLNRQLGLAALLTLLILALLQFSHLLTINSIINIFTIIAIVIPVYYFVKIVTSDKITSTERSRVWAYIPLFILLLLFYFGPLKNKARWYLPYLQTIRRVFISTSLVIRFISHQVTSRASILSLSCCMCHFLLGYGIN